MLAIGLMSGTSLDGVDACLIEIKNNKFTIKEISSKNLFDSSLGIIMPYLCDGELKDTVLKDLYKANYLKNEISEKIRLFYVALTRCREKMIIVTSLDDDRDGYDKLVPNMVRIKYRSFLDILNSIKAINKYVIDKEVACNKEYKKIILKELDNEESKVVINKHQIKLEYHKNDHKHYSKENTKLMTIDEVKKMQIGTKIHEEMEYANFKDDSNLYIKDLLSKVPSNFINSYHEYEFSYEIDNTKYYGVIDLILEYDTILYVIDYKLKSISDEAYTKQLDGYKHYLESITDKEIKVYLYSILDKELREV